jgi:RES domain-containing protein
LHETGLTGDELHVYRVIEPRKAAEPFSGSGADAGGRWTSPRTPGVYASLTPASAILEYLVHLEGDTPRELLMATASVPVECVLAQVELPSEWPERPYRDSVRQVGDEWSKTRRSLVLRVPSAVVAGEHNVVINPEHRDFVKLQLEQLTPIKLDSRLRF